MSGTITGSHTAGITLSSPAYLDPVTVGYGAVVTVTVARAAAIEAPTAWTVINDGVVAVTGGSFDDAVYLVGGGLLVNQAGGTVSAQGYGVVMDAAGTVTNVAGGTIAASVYRGISGAQDLTVDNNGVILGGTNGDGVFINGYGTVTNAAGGVITTSSSTYFGVLFGNAGTVINAGTIGGGAGAVSFPHDASSLLVVEPGGVFRGTVDGGNTVGSGYASTLELAPGSGTLSSPFTNFGVIQFDTGAQWLLAGSTDALAGGEAIDGFAPGDTIELVGTVEHFSTFASGMLTLDGGNTLDFAGVASFTAGEVTNDGTNTFIADKVATITGTHTAGATLTPAVYVDPVTVASDATINITAATAANGIYAATAWTVVNDGLVAATGYVADIGIVLAAGGLVSNASGATVSAAESGVRLLAGGTLSNAAGGTIAATKFGAVDAFGASPNSATVFNQGVIHSGTFTSAYGVLLAVRGVVSNAAGGVISAAGEGVLLNDGGTVNNAAGGTIGAATDGAVAVFTSGTVVNGGLIGGGDGASSYGVFLGSGLVSNAAGGLITAAGTTSYGVEVADLGTVVNAGTIGGAPFAVSFGSGYADRLVVAAGAVFMGAVDGGNTIGAPHVSTLELAPGLGTLATPFTNFGAIVFDAGAQWLLAGSAAELASGEAIAGFTPGDTIELAGTVESYATLAGGVLTLSGGSTLDLPGVASFTAGQVTNSGGNTFITACFASGTSIATARGVVRVEALREGELVFTAAGRLAPVRWIGRRRVDLRRHTSPHDVMPVRVMAGAFGAGLPVRDLVLSPDHAVFVDGHLVPIRHLINGASIAQEARASVTYWHVELDRHDVILAEGLACETYLDTGNRSAFEGEAAVMLHADFARAVWDAEGCAPILTDPADRRLRALHLRILARGQNRKTPLPSSWRSNSV